MRHDTVITVLLILIGIMLALVLFGAGAIWRGRRQYGSRLTNIMRLRVPSVVLGSGLHVLWWCPVAKDGADLPAQARTEGWLNRRSD